MGLVRRTTAFHPRNPHSISIEANPMITIEPPSSFEATLSASTLTRFLNRARTAVGMKGAVDVLLANDPTLRHLNKTFRGKNKPTDVLSFPAPSAFAAKHAGDLAISLETAARQAATHGHPLPDEIKILILHGLLHLSGEDHETDNGEMAAREATLRRELRLPTTLIERTTRTTTKKHLTTTRRPSKTAQKSSSRSAQKSSSKKPSSRPTKKASSRPKAAHFAAAVEEPALSLPKGPPLFARTTSAAHSKKRGSK
jgi:probable rRNA maturation factor